VKYESRKILDFAMKKEKIDIFGILLLFILVFNYFEVFIIFWDFYFFLVFESVFRKL
jgi:hypothetical protein